MIKCGHCGQGHPTVARVRECSTTGAPEPVKAKESLAVLGQQAAKLLRDREVPARYAEAAGRYLESGDVTQKGLETMIAILGGHPARLVGEGVYLFNGEIYRVVKAQESGKCYAKHIEFRVKGKRPVQTYAPGVYSRLRAEHAMTIDQINELAQSTGWCGICGRFLTNPKSVARGIGPVCWEKVQGGLVAGIAA